jgi:hypothetical protein
MPEKPRPDACYPVTDTWKPGTIVSDSKSTDTSYNAIEGGLGSDRWAMASG